VASEARVCAIIVTYFPDLHRLEQLLRALVGPVANTVIVDNGSPMNFEGLAATYPALIVEKLDRNRGIATAQNRGIEAAKRLGATHVIFLDQDSVPEPHMVHLLLDKLRKLQDAGKRVACVGPEIRAPDGGPPARFARLAFPTGADGTGRLDGVVECLFLISSGTLVPMTVIDDVGNMEDRLFIDVVDEEWCLRARAKGYRIFGVRGAVLSHRLGDSASEIWLGRHRRVPRHKPLRYYYIFRNTIAVSRRRYTPLRWKVRRLILLAKLFLAYGVFTGMRGGELGAMVKGIRHGLRGVTGELER
jgi:rhamnosyltransferase